MATDKHGRIWFAKNPWPQGHALKYATWGGRLDPLRGLVFDLDLQTANYNAQGEGREGDRDWESPIVWENYNRCSLSSTKWKHRGFVVGTAKKRLDWRKLSGTTYKVDPAKTVLPHYSLEAAFGIYLTGHDGVADHRITFTRGKTWSVDWKAKIALAYVGNLDLDYRMRAELHGLTFTGFAIPMGMGAKAAQQAFSPLVTDPAKWKIVKRRFVRA